MAKKNFLIGKGERLTEDVRVVTFPGDKSHPYTFDEAKRRLQPMITKLAAEIKSLPPESCPEDYAVATITLNPEYLAKSFYPADLLRENGLRAVGSRPRRISPKKRSNDRPVQETSTTELFVMGKRQSFLKIAEQFPNWIESTPGAGQIVEVEEISFPKAETKIKAVSAQGERIVYEIVLHLNEEEAESRFLSQFRNYLLKTVKINPNISRRFYAGGLCFVELEAEPSVAQKIAEFSLVRVIRKMPELRLLQPAVRTSDFPTTTISLPEAESTDSTISVAIFDGGIPKDHPICRWANSIETEGLMPASDELLRHGVSVTSAFLFGHIDPTKPIFKPYSKVDHYRVLDEAPGQNKYELYQVLNRIKNVLDTKNYDFINLSLGPCLPIDDDEIHAWTAVLDEYLSDGSTLATIAVGNDGEADASIGANRVQVPSDCVNALSIGACDLPDDNWQRAPYSSVGPGRSPGLVKPDLVDFGGSVQRPFLTVDHVDGHTLRPTAGTSFSSPSALRIGTGIRAHFGGSLNALAIRALLVHSAENSEISRIEVGRGRVARSIEDIVICQDHVARVVYQGRITASKYLRASIPLPAGSLTGMVTIKATLVYATPCDPHHPENYTRSGLEVTFRPHKQKKNKPLEGKPNPTHAASKSFFGRERKQFQTEEELRRDAFKWENCLHSEVKMRGTSLNDPVFDIHFNARHEGHNDSRNQVIEYALVVTVEAPKINDLYDQIVRRYATQLEQLRPIVDVPVRVF